MTTLFSNILKFYKPIHVNLVHEVYTIFHVPYENIVFNHICKNEQIIMRALFAILNSAKIRRLHRVDRDRVSFTILSQYLQYQNIYICWTFNISFTSVNGGFMHWANTIFIQFIKCTCFTLVSSSFAAKLKYDLRIVYISHIQKSSPIRRSTRFPKLYIGLLLIHQL